MNDIPPKREPSDEEKDAAICEQCHGEGVDQVNRTRKCWWCEGRGHRL